MNGKCFIIYWSRIDQKKTKAVLTYPIWRAIKKNTKLFYLVQKNVLCVQQPSTGPFQKGTSLHVLKNSEFPFIEWIKITFLVWYFIKWIYETFCMLKTFYTFFTYCQKPSDWQIHKKKVSKKKVKRINEAFLDFENIYQTFFHIHLSNGWISEFSRSEVPFPFQRKCFSIFADFYLLFCRKSFKKSPFVPTG